jgi:hypothetical protein
MSKEQLQIIKEITERSNEKEMRIKKMIDSIFNLQDEKKKLECNNSELSKAIIDFSQRIIKKDTEISLLIDYKTDLELLVSDYETIILNLNMSIESLLSAHLTKNRRIEILDKNSLLNCGKKKE